MRIKELKKNIKQAKTTEDKIREIDKAIALCKKVKSDIMSIPESQYEKDFAVISSIARMFVNLNIFGITRIENPITAQHPSKKCYIDMIDAKIHQLERQKNILKNGYR